MGIIGKTGENMILRANSAEEVVEGLYYIVKTAFESNILSIGDLEAIAELTTELVVRKKEENGEQEG